MKVILNELNETIKKKENEILNQIKQQQEKKKKIAELMSEN